MPADLAAMDPVFDLGWGRMTPMVGVHAPQRDTLRIDGMVHFDLGRAPCGDLRVRPRWARGGARCSNAAGDVLVATVARGSNHVTCAR
jgi:hypothetical protein